MGNGCVRVSTHHGRYSVIQGQLWPAEGQQAVSGPRRLRRGPEGSIAIAAVDATAVSCGNPVGDLPGNFADWVTAHGADEPEWRESLEELSERLRAALQ